MFPYDTQRIFTTIVLVAYIAGALSKIILTITYTSRITIKSLTIKYIYNYHYYLSAYTFLK